jgi:Zn-dependent protease
MADKLGDPTARLSGRLTLNPIKHIDLLGFMLMVFAGFGWARPVQVDTRYFKKPKRDMALTALAGPVSNFILSFALLLVYAPIYRFMPESYAKSIVINLILNTAFLSIGLGVFNLVPVSPLDGSKILFSFLPERIYFTVLRYERYGVIILILLIYSGWISGYLYSFNSLVIKWFMYAADLPYRLFA